MIRYHFATVFSLMAALIAAATATSAAGQPVEVEGNASLDEIGAAWKRREERIRSGEFVWNEVRVMSRGPTDLNRGPFGPPPGMEKKGTITDRDTYQHEYERELLFQGDRLRYSTNEPVWAVGEERYIPFEFVRATDGHLYRVLEERRLPNVFRYQGAILPGAQEGIRSLMALKPLLLHFQPFRYDPDFLSQFTRVKSHGIIDERRCVILERIKDPRGPLIESVWLDPEQEFCVRRLLRQCGSVATTRFDIFYDLDAEHGPVPNGWRLVEHFPNGEFDRSFEATVVTARVNHEVPDDRFDIEFPVNTLVRDASGSAGREAVQYIVRADGQKRIVLPEEMARAKTPEELISTETGLAGIQHPQRSRWPRLLLAALAIVIALVAAIRIYRARSAPDVT